MKEFTATDAQQGKKVTGLLLRKEEFATHAKEGKLPHSGQLLQSMAPVRYCKIEKFVDCLLGTMKVPPREGQSGFAFGFYLRGEEIYFIQEDEMDGSHPLEGILREVIRNVPAIDSAGQFLLILLEVVIAEDVLQLQRLEEGLSSIENELLEKIPEAFNRMIIGYQKKLTSRHAYYEQLMNMGDMMQSNLDHWLDEEERRGWAHFTGRAERLHDHAEALREYLMQIRALYQAQIDAQQNRVITLLTVITTIFLPLTLIAGWYGMNFPQMPEFHWKYGYIAVIATGLAIVAGEILYFKKKKML